MSQTGAVQMRIVLSFDIEVWCQGWHDLDAQFPHAFDRYIYGKSKAGSFALPKTLEILGANGLHGVFFVEPLFAARFGPEYLRQVVALIQEAGQEVQLHLHPEWTDEITPLPFAGATRKRRHLWEYSLEEQSVLIALGVEMLQMAGAPRPTAFRAGNFGANENTFRALAANGIRYDSSINATIPDCVPDLRGRLDLHATRELHGVVSCPVAVFRDGTGRLRHAQVGACSAPELEQAIAAAARSKWQSFVIFSHNFEMLRQESSLPDWFVVNRFRRLCAFLKSNAATLATGSFEGLSAESRDTESLTARVGVISTARRYGEQALRRLL